MILNGYKKDMKTVVYKNMNMHGVYIMNKLDI